MGHFIHVTVVVVVAAAAAAAAVVVACLFQTESMGTCTN